MLVHLVGFALVFGPWAVEALGRRRVTRLMTNGLGLALLTGLILSAPWGLEGPLDYVKIGVKLVVLIVIGALLGIGSARQRRTGSLPAGLFWPVGILALLNAGLAVVWR